MSEQWRTIPGFIGYEVSNHGRVRSYRQRGVKGKLNSHPRLLSPSIKGIGYEFVQLRRKGKSYTRTVHSLVALAFIGPCPKGMQCCHNDGDPTNNHIGNIRYDTPANNAADKARHGSRPLSAKEIRRVREEYQDSPRTFTEIAQGWDCESGVIGDIIRGRTYVSLGGPISTDPSPKRSYKIGVELAKRIYRERQSKGVPYKRLGDKYGISESMAYRICSGERWPEASSGDFD